MKMPENKPKLPKKSVQELLIAKVSELTKGQVKINWDHANEIINTVLTNSKQAYVVHWRYSSNNKGGWEKVRNLATTDELIDQRIREAIEKAPVMDFYKFECFNSEGNKEGEIYTINPFLFD